MDPKDTWKAICNAFADGRVEDALWHMDDLQNWLKRGGFRPDGVPFLEDVIASWKFLEAVNRELNLRTDPDL